MVKLRHYTSYFWRVLSEHELRYCNTQTIKAIEIHVQLPDHGGQLRNLSSIRRKVVSPSSRNHRRIVSLDSVWPLQARVSQLMVYHQVWEYSTPKPYEYFGIIGWTMLYFSARERLVMQRFRQHPKCLF